MSLKESLGEAMAFQQARNYTKAEAIYASVLKDNPDQPDATHLLGLIRMEQDRDVEALELLERALKLFPQAAHFHHNIAGFYRRMGRLDDAERHFREAISLKPDYGEAYQGVAEMIKLGPEDPVFSMLSEQLSQSSHSEEMRSYFHFAAGIIFDGIGQYKEAFQHFKQGNELAKRTFSSDNFHDFAKKLVYEIGPSVVEVIKGKGLKTEVPTFIVGMPRSGTSLVEQILASHSQVFGSGELNDVKQISNQAQPLSTIKEPFPKYLPGLSPAAFKRMGEEYLMRQKNRANDESVTRIIDKHPLNFQFVGMIFGMFPNARIIHTVRDPLDTCLSCYFQNFTLGQDYSFDFKSLGRFYNDYRRLMEHWESVYPGKIYSVNYEDVVADQEVQTRRLLDFMGLDFEPQCIEFHKTDRKVSTASFMQVRQPIYKTSQNRWMNYREELRELAEIIGVPIEEPITISGRVPGLS